MSPERNRCRRYFAATIGDACCSTCCHCPARRASTLSERLPPPTHVTAAMSPFTITRTCWSGVAAPPAPAAGAGPLRPATRSAREVRLPLAPIIAVVGRRQAFPRRQVTRGVGFLNGLEGREGIALGGCGRGPGRQRHRFRSTRRRRLHIGALRQGHLPLRALPGHDTRQPALGPGLAGGRGGQVAVGHDGAIAVDAHAHLVELPGSALRPGRPDGLQPLAPSEGAATRRHAHEVRGGQALVGLHVTALKRAVDLVDGLHHGLLVRRGLGRPRQVPGRDASRQHAHESHESKSSHHLPPQRRGL